MTNIRCSLSLIIAMAMTILVTSPAMAQGNDESVEELVLIIRGDDPVASAAAIRAIAGKDSPPRSAILALIDELDDDRPAESLSQLVPVKVDTVASVAATALADLGKPAVKPICRYLANSRATPSRVLAIRALSQMKAEAIDALPTLQTVLRDPEHEIRFEALAAVISIQRDRARLSVWLSPLLVDESPDVRAAAVRAVGELGEAGARHVNRLVAILDDKESRSHSYSPDMVGSLPVRYDAVMALANMREDARVAIDRLREMMNRDTHSEVRVAAAFAIATLDGNANDGLEFLIESIQNQDSKSEIIEASLSAIGELGPDAKKALPVLEEGLRHSERMVRIRAIQAAARVSPESIEDRLLHMSQDKDALVRATAIETLAMASGNSPKLLAAFVGSLDDNDSDVRYAAIVAIGKFPRSFGSVFPRIKKLVDEEKSFFVKAAAVELIRKIEHQESKPNQW